ncbi:hypothetical protein AcW1_008715 [Taiwanofungus camphoratus]|nr:hypothetical protein AcW1_008715 [Antrodia cinnamomea]
MQIPTLTNIHIRSAEDAHKIFYAVQLGILPKIDKRLDAHERAALRPGDIYVWEKKGPSADAFSVSMERFTEGKSWTASRVREDFLMYFENKKKPKGRGSAQRAKSSENRIVRPGEQDQYIKLTYSVYRNEPGDASASSDDPAHEPRKWHLNAYFTKLTEGSLRTIDDIPMLRDLVVPAGTFRSARTSKAGKKGDAGKAPSASVKRTFAPFPSNYRAHPHPHPHPHPHDPQPGPSTLPAPPPSALAFAAPEHEPASYAMLAHAGLPLPPPHAAPRAAPALPPVGAGAVLMPDPDDSAQGAPLPEEIGAYTPAPLAFAHPPADAPPGPGCEYGSSSLSSLASALSPLRRRRRRSSASASSPSLSDRSLPSRMSLPSPLSPALSSASSSSSSFSSSPSSSSASASARSSYSASPLLAEFPLTDAGTPYTPAPGPDPGRHLLGAARVDLAPLRALRTHPYRRCPADDRALRMLGPGAR